MPSNINCEDVARQLGLVHRFGTSWSCPSSGHHDQEKHPTLLIWPTHFKCEGGRCTFNRKGGDVYTLVMQVKNLTFRKAFEWLKEQNFDVSDKEEQYKISKPLFIKPDLSNKSVNKQKDDLFRYGIGLAMQGSSYKKVMAAIVEAGTKSNSQLNNNEYEDINQEIGKYFSTQDEKINKTLIYEELTRHVLSRFKLMLFDKPLELRRYRGYDYDRFCFNDWEFGYWELVDKSEIRPMVTEVAKDLNIPLKNSLYTEVETLLYAGLPGFFVHKDEIKNNDFEIPILAETAETIEHKKGYLDIKDEVKFYEEIVSGRFYFNGINTYYDPSAQCPKINKFLDEITCENYELKILLLQIVAYCLTKDISKHKAFIFLGQGRNGKGTFVSLIERLLGKHAVYATSFRKLLTSSFESAYLYEKQLVLINEMPKSLNQNHDCFDLFKSLISGDAISAEYKYGSAFMFKPKAKFIISCNSLTKGIAGDHALRERLIIVPFNRNFSQDEIIPNLAEQMFDELPGFLNMVLQTKNSLLNMGSQQFIDSGMDDLEEQAESDNKLTLWAEECCEYSEGDFVSNAALWQSYCDWCMVKKVMDNDRVNNNRTFGRLFKDIKFGRLRVTPKIIGIGDRKGQVSRRGWVNIKLRESYDIIQEF